VTKFLFAIEFQTYSNELIVISAHQNVISLLFAYWIGIGLYFWCLFRHLYLQRGDVLKKCSIVMAIKAKKNMNGPKNIYFVLYWHEIW